MRTRSANRVCELIESEGFDKIKRTAQDRPSKLSCNWILTQGVNIPRLAAGQQATVALRRECEPDPQTEFASCFKSNVVSTKEKIPVPQNEDFGGNNWTRTSDPLHVKQVL